MSLQILLWKDLRRELRGKEGLAAGLVLVALFLMLDLWAFNDLSQEPRTAAAILWTPLVFATAAIVGRGMATEVDRGTMEWLRSLPISPGLTGLSRTLIDGALALFIAMVTVFFASLLFTIPVSMPLLVVMLLGIVGLVTVGALTGGLAAHASAREVILPIMLVPVVAPLLMACMQATITVLAGGTWSDIRAPLLIAGGFDLVAAGTAWLLWPIIVEGD
jgi:ABC-type transport system involved in cytochrome c biogenesis permease component